VLFACLQGYWGGFSAKVGGSSFGFLAPYFNGQDYHGQAVKIQVVQPLDIAVVHPLNTVAVSAFRHSVLVCVYMYLRRCCACARVVHCSCCSDDVDIVHAVIARASSTLLLRNTSTHTHTQQYLPSCHHMHVDTACM
jgi:hypothetical protein